MATRLTRSQLALFLPTLELIKGFEAIDLASRQTNPEGIAAAQATADSALELATAERLGIFDQRQQRTISIQAGDGIQVTPDALGYTVTVDLLFLVNALRAFLPKPQPLPPPANDSQAILANKIFGR
jgi:hypothetical protein